MTMIVLPMLYSCRVPAASMLIGRRCYQLATVSSARSLSTLSSAASLPSSSSSSLSSTSQSLPILVGSWTRQGPSPASPQPSLSSLHCRTYTSTRLSPAAADDLSSLLSRELQEEKGGEEEGDESTDSPSSFMPPELSDLLSKVEERWRIVDEAAGGASGLGIGSGSFSSSEGVVRMHKKGAIAGGGKVAIAFHCQDSIAVEAEDDVEGGHDGSFGAVDDHAEGEDGDGDEDEDEESVAVRFSTTVTKAGKVMVLSCVSEYGQATVEGVALVDDLEAGGGGGGAGGANSVAESVWNGIEDKLYQGPKFNELAEDVQEAFTTYLRETLEVNDDVAAFVGMYADYKEQTEYVKWLEGVKKIIE